MSPLTPWARERDIASQIVGQGGDYILCVKGNQGTLHKEIEDQFHFAARQLATDKLDPKKWSHAGTLEKGHGRIERRQTVVCQGLSWMDENIREAWTGLSCIIMVSRQTELPDGKTRSQTSYYISSLQGQGAAEIQHLIRSHWAIENSCHWVLDTLFREDHNQTSQHNAAKNLSTMRRIALNILKRAPDQSKRKRKRPPSLTKKQLRASQDESYLENILSLA